MIATTTDTPTALNRPYRPQGAAEKLFYCKDAEILIEGPAGTGKSRAILEKILLLAEKYAGCRVLLIRKTRESMTDTILVTFEDKVMPPGHPAMQGAQRKQRHSYRFPNGSEIVLGGLDKSSRVMSSDYDVVAVFEATEISEDDWEHLTTRVRNAAMPYQQCIADCNPDAPTHWLNQRADNGRMTRLRSRHEDNPTVTPEYLSKLDALSGVRRLRLREGLWAAAEGMVYESWDASAHLLPAMVIPAGWRRIRVVDFGYTNPFICQWWAVDDDGRMYLYREIYKTRTLVEDHATQILALSDGETIEATVADHDAEDRATLDRYGIPTIAAHKAVSPGIESVQARLRTAGDGRPRLFLVEGALVERDGELSEARRPLCTSEEITSYVWQHNSDGRPVKEQPVKIDDHGMDAMRYAVAYVDGIGRMPLDARVLGNDTEAMNDERFWR